MTEDATSPQLTRLQRRLIDAAADIIEEQADSPEYLHSVLCQVGLPRAQTDARSFGGPVAAEPKVRFSKAGSSIRASGS